MVNMEELKKIIDEQKEIKKLNTYSKYESSISEVMDLIISQIKEANEKRKSISTISLRRIYSQQLPSESSKNTYYVQLKYSNGEYSEKSFIKDKSWELKDFIAFVDYKENGYTEVFSITLKGTTVIMSIK